MLCKFLVMLPWGHAFYVIDTYLLTNSMAQIVQLLEGQRSWVKIIPWAMFLHFVYSHQNQSQLTSQST